MEFGAGTVTSAMSTLGCVIGLRRERSCGPSQGYPGPHPSPDDRQHSQRVCSLPPRDATLPIQLDIDSSKVDVRSPTIGPWRPRSPEMRGTEECRGRPSWVRTTRWSVTLFRGGSLSATTGRWSRGKEATSRHDQAMGYGNSLSECSRDNGMTLGWIDDQRSYRCDRYDSKPDEGLSHLAASPTSVMLVLTPTPHPMWIKPVAAKLVMGPEARITDGPH